MNFFKKTEAPREYPPIVQDIHHEFLTASEDALKEAREIISNAPGNKVSKGNRLANLGFGKCPEVLEAKKIVETKEIADLIEHYRVYYPNNKFIMDSQVKAICEKYGLVHGEISAFKGFVPEGKLSLMENFSLRKEDSGLCTSIGFIKGARVDKDHNYYHLFKIDRKTDWEERSFQSSDGRDFYSQDYSNNFGLAIKGDMRFVVKQPLSICAPLKDMEVDYNQRVVGHEIQDIPDPVVLHQVQGGYLIIAAWGDEANDENVINHNKN